MRPIYGLSYISSFALSLVSCAIVARVYCLNTQGVNQSTNSGGAKGCHSLLVEVRPDMNNEYHNEEHTPARERAEPTGEARLIKKEADTDGAEDL